MARVLVVDDEIGARNSLRRLLIREGHEVETAADGNAAFRLIFTTEPYDILLLDLHMPGMAGATFLQFAPSIEPLRNTAIVITTGADVVSLRSSGMLQAAAAIFPKPIDFDKLLRLIENSTRDTIPPPTEGNPA
jgi:DNA-binding NtrC family response regulator